MNTQVPARFNKAAPTYAQNGSLQAEVASDLSILFDHTITKRILEIGCGTGFLTEKLFSKYGPDTDYLITDIAPDMVDACRNRFADAAAVKAGRVVFTTMDGQKPDVSGKFDLIATSMTIQWFDNPAQSLEDLRKHLTQYGSVVYATIGPDNFKEWRSILAKHGLPAGMRGDLPQKLPGQTIERRIKRDYGSARGFHDMLKKTGANTPCKGYTKPDPKKYLEACREFDGKTTWHIVYGRLRANP